MSFNGEIISELLHENYKYDGIVCADFGLIEGFSGFGIGIVEPKSWGDEKLSIKRTD